MIEVSNLNHYFGSGDAKETVLKDVNLEVGDSQLVVLSGPSGSGKTTLLTIIGAVRRAYAGSVKVNGQEIVNGANALLEQTRRGIGYIFQHHNLVTSLTTEQNVCMSLELGTLSGESKRRARAKKALAAVDMDHRASFYPAALSGGQKQRVSIARALAGEPKIILADEPTASLDKVNAMRVIELMRKEATDSGTCVIVVSHDSRWYGEADRVVKLDEGCIRAA